ncbi:MAG: cysteine--1-D-myo-inosityl 2-amino-2-deoxy-alpha-D-glucopyranoside ligase, partial [Mycobacteriales bacterium]
SEPTAIRLALLSDHYRGYREWENSKLALAEQRLGRWRKAVASPGAAYADPAPLLAELRSRLADDLDTPGALEAVDLWADAVMAAPATGDDRVDVSIADVIEALLGVR